MYSKILVAIDGSESSVKALKKAINIASSWNANLYGLYAINVGIYGTSIVDPSLGVSDPSSDKIFDLLKTEGNEILKNAKKIASEANYPVEFISRFGDARDTILEYASDISADLIIVGSTGKGKAQRFLLGSVSSAVVVNSKISVLVVR
ncbi:nucleotide-binding universal stress UspA family protein [Methanomicrobium sp. W14]|uniref:universal stress protein n=1 Tax=Methanomicrobium sp. W14 TaxID=2817839 RepID=UPI001AE7C653|nr:universal stress protein [Methanomicrobium sp. W14]MBP2133782.1 nucleotide-binding universal stress UspA family protein [Methanomicrobium sp. W14]